MGLKSRLLSKKRLLNLQLVFLCFFIFVHCKFAFAVKQEDTRHFDVMPWQVGQFVEYQIISMEGEGQKNLYRISLMDQENINGKIYFWEQIDIYELRKERAPEFKKNITFLALVPPIITEDFTADPGWITSFGFFPHNAVKLKVQIFDNPFVEVDPKTYFSHQDIIEDTEYSITPEAMGKIDFFRLQVARGKKKVSVPAGDFNCTHIFVITDADREYWDEGFDLWRTPEVPLFGIVKMKFSNTLYWEKWSHRNEPKRITSLKDFFSYLYNKRVPGRRRLDTYVINLLRYGKN